MADSGLAYHQGTCYQRHGMDSRGLDWANQPSPYKTYPDIVLIDLPEVADFPRRGLWPVAAEPREKAAIREPGLEELARVLDLGNSLTAGRRQMGQTFYFRSAASAGALYPTELYLAAHRIRGLAPGIYHHAIGRRALGLLEPGRVGNIWQCLGTAPAREAWAALFFITGRFFRSAWKYGTRGYRYVLLDSGHLAGNLVLALNCCGLSGEIYYDFDDQALAGRLGLEPGLEGVLACIALWGGSKPPDRNEEAPDVPDTPAARAPGAGPRAQPLCARERVNPGIEAIHQAGAGSLADPPPGFSMVRQMALTATPGPALRPAEIPAGSPSCAQAVLNRRSKRNFVDDTLARETFNALVELVRSHYYRVGPGRLYTPPLVNIAVLTGAVAGIEPGYYQLDPREPALGKIASGHFTAPMAAVCLNQAWLARAAVHFVLSADLGAVENHLGPRGYRRTLIQAGSLGQTIYLAATALGLGACGIGAYYDHEARQLLGLKAECHMLYLLAAGPVKG